MGHATLKFRAAIVAAAAATVGFASATHAQVLFTDDFDAGTSGANYDVFTCNPASTFSHNFAEDYGLLQYTYQNQLGVVTTHNVPSAPNSVGGTKTGLVMRINDTLPGAVNSMSAYPKEKNFTGNYKLTFDMWINYNGGPVGGLASTEWMLAGINQGTAGNKVAGPTITGTIGGTNTGNSFAVNGEHGNSETMPGTDYRTYVNQANKNTLGFAAPNTIGPTNNNQQSGLNPYYNDPVTGVFPNPDYETSGAPGKHWTTVEIGQIAGVLTWKMNNRVITSYPDITNTSGNITLGYADWNSGAAAPDAVPYQFIIYDNIKVENAPTSLYWDIDGTTAGAGGAAPAGNWDGTALSFNSDSTGAAGGVVTPHTSINEDVIFCAGADGTGTYTVTVTGSRTAKSVSIARGNVDLTGGTISTPTFDVAAGATGTVSSNVTGGPTGSLTKKGAGTLNITSTNTYTGGTTVEAGTLVVNRLHGLAANGTGTPNPVSITGGTLQVRESSPTIASGHPGGNNAFVSRPGSMITIANDGGTIVSSNPATLTPRIYNGKLDLTNNDLIIDYSATSPIADVEDMIRAGRNGGAWNGNGITSSTAGSIAAAGAYTLGVIDNATPGITPFTTFSGQTVDTTTILVKFVHRSDINMDGIVTFSDSVRFNGNYSEGTPTRWVFGDLNYNGVSDFGDSVLFNGGYDEALASLPEPGAAVVGLGMLGSSLARRRKS